MRVLLLCASHNDLGLIKALRKLGFEILVTGNRPGLSGERYADEYICADYSDKEQILKIAKEKKIDRICASCNDFAVYTAAYVAEKMGLPGYDSYETTELLHNKDKFKEFAKKYKIPSPHSVSFTEMREAEKYLHETEYPVIIKPTDASAGNGIHRVDNEREAQSALQDAFQTSRKGVVVIEPYLSGKQHGFCTYLLNQRVAAVLSNNEYSILNPYRVEIDTFPADDFEKVSSVLIAEIEKIADILQLADGIFHLQYITTDAGPQIIEVMRRVPGNMYFWPGNLLTGIDWDYWEARANTGLGCHDFPQPVKQEGYFAYKTILAPKNGVIDVIRISERYNKYVLDTYLLKHSGDTITNYRSEPVGFLFLMFSSQEEMQHFLIDEYDSDMVKMRE